MASASSKPYLSKKIMKRKSKSNYSSKAGMAECIKAMKAAMAKSASNESAMGSNSIITDDSCNQNPQLLPTSALNTVQGVQLSPTKLLHVAKLKCRFADTIFKANQKNQCFDQVKLQREKEKFARQQAQELKKIEAQINRYRADLKRQEERKAARLLIEKMERSVFFDHLPDFRSEQDDEKTTAQFMDFVRKQLFMS